MSKYSYILFLCIYIYYDIDITKEGVTLIKKLTKNKIIIISCILMLIIGVFICIMLLNGKSNASNNGTTSYESLQRRTKITHDGSTLQITRNILSNEPLVTNGSWTILMYICRSDLESQFKCATQDIEEIMESKWKDKNTSLLHLFQYYLT